MKYESHCKTENSRSIQNNSQEHRKEIRRGRNETVQTTIAIDKNTLVCLIAYQSLWVI